MLEFRPCAEVALKAKNRKSSNIFGEMAKMLEDWPNESKKASLTK